jgi:CRISPR-associated endonuclease Csn1
LQDGTLVQVDHILPRSRSFDNSYMNKVLVFSGENQDKGDRTPWEYFQADKPDHAWDELMARIAHWPKPKRDRLTNQHFNEREAEWKERHLNDTRWITRQVLNHIQATLALPGEPNQTNVMALNGKITADLRHAWGFARKSRTTPKHHAIDAMVIAACTQTMVQRVTAFNKYRARARALGEQVYAPNPWPTFRQDVMARIDDPNWIISRLANRKVTGEINGPNPARTRKNAQGEEREVIRLTLAGLKKEQVKKLDAMIDKETRNKWLYDALLQAIADAGGDPQKAFKPPFTLNTPSGPKVIKKVSLWGDKIMSGRRLRGGVVSNGSQVRVDVFEKDGKFYLVPVFAWHFRVGHLPMGYCKQKVAQENWPEIDDSYTFKFSLYSNDYVRCVKPNGEVVAGYYKTTHIAMGQICIQPHDAPDTTNLPHPGVLTLKTFEKFHVDYFGKLTLVTETVRPPVKWRKKSRVAHHYGSKARQTVPTP